MTIKMKQYQKIIILKEINKESLQVSPERGPRWAPKRRRKNKRTGTESKLAK